MGLVPKESRSRYGPTVHEIPPETRDPMTDSGPHQFFLPHHQARVRVLSVSQLWHYSQLARLFLPTTTPSRIRIHPILGLTL